MQISFKKWLLNEAGFDDSGSDWFFGNYLLPSDAFDWPYAYSSPSDFLFLKSRWEGDRKQGRKFINIDLDSTLKTKFVTLKSNTMPNEENWIHKKDDRPNITVDNNAWFGLIGIGEKSDNVNKLVKLNDLLDMTDELNQTFGKFTPKYTKEAEDSPWY